MLKLAPDAEVITVRFKLGDLRTMAGASAPIGNLRGARVMMIAAVGNPGAFSAQLAAAGAQVAESVFADHHAFTDAEIAHLAKGASAYDFAVCTLKDAVKLESKWPRATAPLWYVSQTVEVERGEDVLDRMLDSLIRSQKR